MFLVSVSQIQDTQTTQGKQMVRISAWHTIYPMRHPSQLKYQKQVAQCSAYDNLPFSPYVGHCTKHYTASSIQAFQVLHCAVLTYPMYQLLHCSYHENVMPCLKSELLFGLSMVIDDNDKNKFIYFVVLQSSTTIMQGQQPFCIKITLCWSPGLVPGLDEVNFFLCDVSMGSIRLFYGVNLTTM